ncbi:MAG: 3-hydroxyacyl-CoA dehydrogenase NAD-binding domain-containing protein [Devosia sp.]
MPKIVKAAVIGAGVMGAGIAAHFANAGVDVVLLDVDIGRARSGIQNQLKAGGFMLPAFADRIVPGSITENLSMLADADWIVEAVAENLAIKQALYRRVDEVRKPGSIVSSNTSTIPLKALTEGMSQSFSEDFLVAHFFNPPRVMRLLEIVAGAQTRPEIVQRVTEFADRRLGKGVVLCKDTPGFIGNRIGNYWMAVAQSEAIARQVDVEIADALIGKPFGIPSTGVFGLLDLVGIDLMSTILRGFQASLPAHDAIQDYPAEPPLIARMIAENRLGRKSGAGFVRVGPEKMREVTDLASGEYRPQRALPPDIEALTRLDPRTLMMQKSPAADYARIVMGKTLAYAAALIPEIADTPAAVDTVMRLGYGWKEGPFELMDRIGVAALAEILLQNDITPPAFMTLAANRGEFYASLNGQPHCLLPDGRQVRTGPGEGVITIAALRTATAPVVTSPVANIWDLGDGVAGLELATKMNTINPALLDFIGVALDRTGRDFQALVIGGDASAFSAGADLREFQSISETGGGEAIRALIENGQSAFRAIKYAPFPVVGAASGLALGGGCELLLHCDAIQAHAELSMGLVETLVGLIPGWGGCVEMLARMSTRDSDATSTAIEIYRLIATATVSSSAFHARELGFLRGDDGITMNRDRLIADAKAAALRLAGGYQPAQPSPSRAYDAAILAALSERLEADTNAQALSQHDRLIRRALIGVIAGSDTDSGPASETQLRARERDAFVNLFGTEPSIARVRHMLSTGKPLRN